MSWARHSGLISAVSIPGRLFGNSLPPNNPAHFQSTPLALIRYSKRHAVVPPGDALIPGREENPELTPQSIRLLEWIRLHHPQHRSERRQTALQLRQVGRFKFRTLAGKGDPRRRPLRSQDQLTVCRLRGRTICYANDCFITSHRAIRPAPRRLPCKPAQLGQGLRCSRAWPTSAWSALKLPSCADETTAFVSSLGWNFFLRRPQLLLTSGIVCSGQQLLGESI